MPPAIEPAPPLCAPSEEAESAALDRPVTRVRPSRGFSPFDLAELWRYRELLYFLAWRDVKIRYKQTALGATWAVLQPLLATLAFSLFFGRLAKVPSDDLPYPLFAFTALLPWQLFAHVLASSSASLVSNERLITKVYFPRLVIPISSVFAALPDLAVASLALVGMLAYYSVAPGLAALALPLFLALALLTAVGAGLWLSALNVRYRDVRYAIPFLTQLWFFVTPIVFSSSMVPVGARPLMGLNPIAGVVEGFRWALLGRELPGAGGLFVVSAAVAAALLASGLIYFRRMERSFADVI